MFLKSVRASVRISSDSDEVMIAPRGKPPAGLTVNSLKYLLSTLSREEVESIKTMSPACGSVEWTLLVIGS